ncbi:MAG: histidine kinase [Blautia faecis]
MHWQSQINPHFWHNTLDMIKWFSLSSVQERGRLIRWLQNLPDLTS